MEIERIGQGITYWLSRKVNKFDLLSNIWVKRHFLSAINFLESFYLKNFLSDTFQFTFLRNFFRPVPETGKVLLQLQRKSANAA